MLLRIIFACSGILYLNIMTAQVPQGISYQAIARQMPSGDELTNTLMSVQLGILNETFVLEYQETHVITSNQFGLINLIVGQGTPTGNGLVIGFDEINWGSGSHFVNIEIEYPGSNGFQQIGQSELLSVPYALYSGNFAPIEEMDGDTTNELITSLSISTDAQSLEIEEGGILMSLDMEPIIEGTWQKENSFLFNTTEDVGIGIDTPSSTLHVEGSYAAAVQVITGTAIYNPNEQDQVMICNVNDGPVTINLPVAASVPGRMYSFRKTYNENLNPFTSNSVTMLVSGGGLIDFGTSYILNWVKPESVVLISDGIQWYVLNYARDEF